MKIDHQIKQSLKFHFIFGKILKGIRVANGKLIKLFTIKRRGRTQQYSYSLKFHTYLHKDCIKYIRLQHTSPHVKKNADYPSGLKKC